MDALEDRLTCFHSSPKRFLFLTGVKTPQVSLIWFQGHQNGFRENIY